MAPATIAPMLIAGVDAAVLAHSLRLLPYGRTAARIPLDDFAARRAAAIAMDARLNGSFGLPAGVRWDDAVTAGPAGPMRIRTYSRPSPGRGVLLYLHGGGLVMGTLEGYEARCAAWAAGIGFDVVVPEYRLAPEHPYPAALDDAAAALAWAGTRAAGRPIALAGDSAGGGLAAALLLRNRAESIAAIDAAALVYPMLDDRTVEPDPRYSGPFVTWTIPTNAASWRAYLQSSAPSEFTSAARATDLRGLPPVYIDTGTLDIFHDEDIAFARRLLRDGVDTEAHIWNGAPHGFDVVAPRSSLGRRAWQARFDFVRRHTARHAA